MSARRTLFGVFSFSFIDFARQQTSLYRSQSITLVSSPCLLAGQGNASGHHPLQPALGLESEEEGEGHLLTLNIRHPSYHHLQQGPPGIQRRRNGWTCPQMKLLSRSSESSTSVEKRYNCSPPGLEPRLSCPFPASPPRAKGLVPDDPPSLMGPFYIHDVGPPRWGCLSHNSQGLLPPQALSQFLILLV
ncbi:uncharacterized protein LOC120408987 isoform X1 [Mauremys reevesii]|uniref:uncharacterized protein LOC120408987 isoform X1 n=1 Tax=Mauremys reevesii TaxID=260615 RepID=UPI00193EE587|nr:uncharacterized protein LOC120408987 isoform X1 [Mauremys reevesii]